MVNYPVILGCDVAGTVETVAPGSTSASRFRVGDRVVEAETRPCGKDDGGGGTGGGLCPRLSDVVLWDFSEALSGMTIVFGREVSDANVPVTARFMFCIELAARGFLNFGGP